VTADAPAPDLARLYRDTRERLTALVAGLDEAALATPVPACPGWLVQDVVAHLAAIVEDALAGRLTGPPSEEETAVQVARYKGRPMTRTLAEWTAGAPQFEEIISAFDVPPAVIDVASHEQDIRGALGRPGARDTEAIWQMGGWLLRGLRSPVPLRVTVEDAEFRVGPPGDGRAAAEPSPGAGRKEAGRAAAEPSAGAGGEEPVLGLTTTRFEAFRWRMGRRSRDQLAALDWSGDPAPVLDHLVVFGPARTDVIE
jgi:uncharacterized protein (TIGR03083 family)